MLTNNDLKQIQKIVKTEVQGETRMIVREETSKIVQSETRKIVREELVTIKEDISQIDKEYHLNLSPLSS